MWCVSLNNTGEVKFYPENMDNGSFDNCSEVFLQVARESSNCGRPEDLEWGDFVVLCCNDINKSPIKSEIKGMGRWRQ